MHPRRLAPFLALPLVVVTAAPAHAAPDIVVGGGNYSYFGLGSEVDTVAIACPGGNVSPNPGTAASCASLTSLYFEPGDGLDTINLAAVSPSAFPSMSSTTIHADTPGDSLEDTFIGSAFRDQIYADNKDVVDAGAGDDYLEGGDDVQGGEGNDTFRNAGDTIGQYGGPGDDRFLTVPVVGETDGGAGDDSLEVDGSSGGIDVPQLDFTFTATNVILQAGPDSISPSVVNVEHLTVTLPDKGAQKVDASAFPGDLYVRGYGGPDTLIGTKNPDVLLGNSGDDTIDARDGAADFVDCGSGVDSAKVDTIDIVIGCETATYPAVTPPATPPNPETSAIRGPKTVAKGAVAKFRFSSPVTGATFQCKVDKKAWKACKSPYAVKTGKLKVGKHTLQVRAVYPAGNADVTPSKKAFKVT